MATTPRLLTVRTREIPQGDPRRDQHLLDLLPGDTPMSWVCEEDGLVGWGITARFDTAGPARFADADSWWRHIRKQLDVDDDVQLPGTGPVAFASMAFADRPGGSVLLVPEVVIGQRDGVRWITTIGDTPADHLTPSPATRPGTIRYSDGQFTAAQYRQAVSEAVQHMRQPSGINKVVLAHDLLATTSQPLDPRFLLRNLARRYPNCWTFSVDGLVGATPELLLERTNDHVRSRVLAGTSWPRDGLDTEQLAKELLTSDKDRDEHTYAIDSLAASLRPFCAELTVPDEPKILRLRNVMHLTSEVSGTLRDNDGSTSLLRMTEAVHPTAAVGGTPTTEAVRMISELEKMDRQRYAGPVGWIDGNGNGEFGIALRCAQIQSSAPQNRQVRLFAGCGIVADSDPDLEVAEAEAKLLPIREALEDVY